MLNWPKLIAENFSKIIVYDLIKEKEIELVFLPKIKFSVDISTMNMT